MELHIPPADVIPYGMRAMKMIAAASGRIDAAERQLIATAQRIYGTEVDLDDLPPITPEELAAKVVSPALRRQFVRGMVILSLVDGEASAAEAALVERFAEALGIESPDLTVLRRLADGHLLRARFDIARRFFAREKAIEMTKAKGVGWLARSVAAMAGLREDPEIAARWLALGELPKGTLGRAYFDFIVDNQFSFPGQKGSPPEVVTFHDLTHVLSGYGTTPSGELQVLAFHAGCRREEKDPFSFLMFGIAEFHLGLAMSPVAAASPGHFDPEPFFAALRRGAACTIDPTDGWDPWPVMHEDLEVLRARYGIAPLS